MFGDQQGLPGLAHTFQNSQTGGFKLRNRHRLHTNAVPSVERYGCIAMTMTMTLPRRDIN